MEIYYGYSFTPLPPPLPSSHRSVQPTIRPAIRPSSQYGWSFPSKADGFGFPLGAFFQFPVDKSSCFMAVQHFVSLRCESESILSRSSTLKNTSSSALLINFRCLFASNTRSPPFPTQTAGLYCPNPCPKPCPNCCPGHFLCPNSPQPPQPQQLLL